jgi:hypothetical protein
LPSNPYYVVFSVILASREVLTSASSVGGIFEAGYREVEKSFGESLVGALGLELSSKSTSAKIEALG